MRTILLRAACGAALLAAGLGLPSAASAACPNGSSNANYCEAGPAVTIAVPRDGGRYSTSVPTRASFGCAFTIHPLTSCVGTVADGAPFDTSAGPHDFTVTGTDSTQGVTSVTSSYTAMPFEDILRADAPLGYFRLGEEDGEGAFANLGGGASGEFKNRTESGPVGVSGDGDHARQFWGDSGYGFVNGLAVPSAWTLVAWVNLTDVDDDPATVRDGTVVEHGRGGAITVEQGHFVARNGSDAAVDPAQVQEGVWYMVVARLGSGSLDLLVQQSPAGGAAKSFSAAPVASASSTYFAGGSPTFYIGYGSHAPWLAAAIDEVAYVPAALGSGPLSDYYYADPVPAQATRRTAVAANGSKGSSPKVPLGGSLVTRSGGRLVALASCRSRCSVRVEVRLGSKVVATGRGRRSKRGTLSVTLTRTKAGRAAKLTGKRLRVRVRVVEGGRVRVQTSTATG